MFLTCACGWRRLTSDMGDCASCPSPTLCRSASCWPPSDGGTSPKEVLPVPDPSRLWLFCRLAVSAGCSINNGTSDARARMHISLRCAATPNIIRIN